MILVNTPASSHPTNLTGLNGYLLVLKKAQFLDQNLASLYETIKDFEIS